MNRIAESAVLGFPQVEHLFKTGVSVGVGNCDHFRINPVLQILHIQTIPASQK